MDQSWTAIGPYQLFWRMNPGVGIRENEAWAQETQLVLVLKTPGLGSVRMWGNDFGWYFKMKKNVVVVWNTVSLRYSRSHLGAFLPSEILVNFAQIPMLKTGGYCGLRTIAINFQACFYSLSPLLHPFDNVLIGPHQTKGLTQVQYPQPLISIHKT